MERISFDMKVFDNFLEITPKGGVKPNSTYEIRLRNVKSADQKKEIERETITLYSRVAPAYCPIHAVSTLLDGHSIDDASIMYNIREASKYANYILGLQTDKEYYFEDSHQAFEVSQFVRYKAAYDCTTKYYIDMISGSGLKGTIGEVSFETPESVADISKLLSDFRTESDKWHLALQGHKEFRAVPRSGVKGINSKSSNLDYPKESGRYFLQRTLVK